MNEATVSIHITGPQSVSANVTRGRSGLLWHVSVHLEPGTSSSAARLFGTPDAVRALVDALADALSLLEVTPDPGDGVTVIRRPADYPETSGSSDQ